MKVVLTTDLRRQGQHVSAGTILDLSRGEAMALIGSNRANAIEPEVMAPAADYAHPVLSTTGQTAKIAVCVTVHQEYLQYLKRQIDAIEAQTVKPAEKFLALDGCEKPDYVPADWNIIIGKGGSPNPGRNTAAKNTTCKWIIFADADDEMHPEYIAAMNDKVVNAAENVGIFYADLRYSDGVKMDTPEIFDFWQLRIGNCVSSCSCWRTAALFEGGGFSGDIYDDWTLALAVTRCGWKAERQSRIPIYCHHHGGNHRHLEHHTVLNHTFVGRTYAIVSLLAGRINCFEDWKRWLMNAELPPMTTVYVLDNSGSVEFGDNVRKFLAGQTKFAFLYQKYSRPIEIKSWVDRHCFVPALYNQILQYVNDDFVCFLEDDVLPPMDGMLKLAGAWNWRNNTGGISGCYSGREIPGIYAATKDITADYWSGSYQQSEITEDKLYPAGCIAGGFALYQNATIKQAMPFKFYYKRDKIACGWDTNFSVFLRQKGFKLWLHGGVKCEHNIKNEAKNDTGAKNIKTENESRSRNNPNKGRKK
jgi:glycosyltransferase involved in cell wall biosynthesis